MPDRITSEPSGIARVRTVADQRWRERTESADNQRDSSKRRPKRRKPAEPRKRGGIDEFA
ncbi:MAG: hypothetical protein RIC56_21955 [Pseudomonadales bacterium]